MKRSPKTCTLKTSFLPFQSYRFKVAVPMQYDGGGGTIMLHWTHHENDKQRHARQKATHV
jgi:hypothetical protein